MSKVNLKAYLTLSWQTALAQASFCTDIKQFSESLSSIQLGFHTQQRPGSVAGDRPVSVLKAREMRSLRLRTE
jgi:hypothetical protein